MRPQAVQRIAVLLLAAGVEGGSVAQTTIASDEQHAWGANVGWVNWQGDLAHGARVGEYVCSGYLYAANLGWIDLGSGRPANQIRYQNRSAADYGVNRDYEGRLTGLAYGANIGWLVFTNRTAAGVEYAAPRVDLASGQLSGFVYSANAGWIQLSNAFAQVRTVSVVPGEDSDEDGLADGWELDWGVALETMDGTSDSDQDGATDFDEYHAHTDPFEPTDRLRISALVINPTEATWDVVWSSKTTRFYAVQRRDGLGPGAAWVDSGLGVVRPDPGGITSRRLPWAGSAEALVRVVVRDGLAPEEQ